MQFHGGAGKAPFGRNLQKNAQFTELHNQLSSKGAIWRR
jgi:hypothetical protein